MEFHTEADWQAWGNIDFRSALTIEAKHQSVSAAAHIRLVVNVDRWLPGTNVGNYDHFRTMQEQ